MNQEFGLGAIVSYNWSDGYADGTICKIHADGTVDVFRPYVQTADFSTSGGEVGSTSVICYIGVETSKQVNVKALKLLRKGPSLR